MKERVSKRMSSMPSYIFAEMEEMKAQFESKGNTVIDLSIGDPNFPTSSAIVEALKSAVDEEKYHHYPPFRGSSVLRAEIADWYKRRFNVDIDPENEVLILLGSKEGLSHISLAYVNPDDIALVPDPGYPAYAGGVLLAGGSIVKMPLLEKNNFFIDVDAIDPAIASKSSIMFLNYPNNPTGATAESQDFERVVAFAKKYGIIVVHDAAYSEVSFEDYNCPSFLQAKDAKKVGVEFHSFSKTFCMTGWRIGMAVGNSEVINQLAKVKSFIDSGVFGAVQVAATHAINNFNGIDPVIKQTYEKRLALLVEGLAAYGWIIRKPRAGYFVWAKVPEGVTSMDFCKAVLEKAFIMLTPGVGFGEYGEGYVRISINVDEEVINNCIESMGNVYRSYSD